MCKLSIIMPVYNTAPFLRRAVDAVLAQSFKDWELILVDDGSKDDSGAICDEYARADSRVTVIHKENGGAGSARNAGLDAAKGELVAFPDSDDRIDTGAYDYCVNMMEREGLDMLVFGSINTVYDADGSIISEQKGRISACRCTTRDECRDSWAQLMATQPMGGPSDKMYRMSLIRENGLRFPDLRRMQDGVFNMLYFDRISSFAAVEEYFYHFTMHPADFQKKKIPADFIECAAVFHRTAIGLLKSWGRDTEANADVLDRRFADAVVSAITDYLPGDGAGFAEVHRYIRSITRNEYVSGFYREYAKTHDLRRLEKAISRRMDLALTVNALRSMRRG